LPPRTTNAVVARRAGAVLLALLAAASTNGAGAQETAEDTAAARPAIVSIVGRAERVALVDGGVLLEAKVDTGADSTSIDAGNIETFEREGEDWVRFETRTNADEVVTFERRIVDTVTILGAGDDRDERLVVEITLCVDDVHGDVEVNLADREGLEYRMLLGRDFLAANGLLVNVAERFIHEPRCDATVER
jgi:hypothetical protein